MVHTREREPDINIGHWRIVNFFLIECDCWTPVVRFAT